MFAKSFDSITKPLKKMIQDLRQHAMEKTDAARAHEDEAARQVQLHNEAVDEADKAYETANNIANLIGEPPASDDDTAVADNVGDALDLASAVFEG